jgi:glycosyltransferase involved in cell wall biosynthesis
MDKLSICIALKNRSSVLHGDKTLQLFPNSMNAISKLWHRDDIEVVIADFNSTDTVLSDWVFDLGLDVKVVNVSGDFSRGKGLNLAAASAAHSHLLFTDADHLLGDDAIHHARLACRRGQAWFPRLRWLDEFGTLTPWRKYSGDGVCAVSKHLFDRTMGWPEFYSWGGEDDLFRIEMGRVARIIDTKCDAIKHQWHPEYCRHENYRNPMRMDYLKRIGK